MSYARVAGAVYAVGRRLRKKSVRQTAAMARRHPRDRDAGTCKVGFLWEGLQPRRLVDKASG
ncbi:hypothetical protein QSH18_06320, partial [Xanthomonas sp. NCPPB 2654]|uniref:hypothetical protein n=1 Tax=Xanthomonas sp. NCPPB 2654 TaxID=487541 RepID=UPI00256F43F8